MRTSSRAIGGAYLGAKRTVIERGYASEIDWQYECLSSEVSEANFLRQAAWVILSSGMREQVVRSRFAAVSAAFRDWKSARIISADRERCYSAAFAAFSHAGKIAAICTVADIVSDAGFDVIRAELRKKGASYLMRFPYIGPVTSIHLAKNLGQDVAKPDRHLVRLAAAVGVASPAQLCDRIAEATAERVAVVDLVLWRYANLHRDYCSQFCRLIRLADRHS